MAAGVEGEGTTWVGRGGGVRAYVAAGVEGDDACNIPKNSPK